MRRAGLVHRHSAAAGVDGGFGVPLAAFTFAHGGPRIDSAPPTLGSTTRKSSPSSALSGERRALDERNASEADAGDIRRRARMSGFSRISPPLDPRYATPRGNLRRSNHGQVHLGLGLD